MVAGRREVVLGASAPTASQAFLPRDVTPPTRQPPAHLPVAEVAHLSELLNWLALELFLSFFSFSRAGSGWGKGSVSAIGEDLIYSTYVKVGTGAGLGLAAKNICRSCREPRFISQYP